MLNFQKNEKKFLPVVFENGEQLFLKTPKKKLFSELIALKTNMETTEEIDSVYDDLLQVTAKVLSTNISGKKVTPDEVDEMFGIEDMALILLEYQNFITSVTSRPN